MIDLLWWLGGQYVALSVGATFGVLVASLCQMAAADEARDVRIWRVDDQP